MELKLLNKEELASLYKTEMVFDFPKAELKPLSGMLRLMERGHYEPLLALENGEAVGYAIMWLSRNERGALLEYLGVLRGKRNGGGGGRILSLLGGRDGQLFGEVEAPDSQDSAENDLRCRRVGFYLRNGFRVLDYECALFGVHFKCIYLGEETNDRRVESMHRNIYASYFSAGHMEKYIQLPLAPGEEIHPAPEWLEEY